MYQENKRGPVKYEARMPTMRCFVIEDFFPMVVILSKQPPLVIRMNLTVL